jgi:hypothetical protein
MVKKEKFSDPMFLIIIAMIVGFINAAIENQTISWILSILYISLVVTAIVKYFGS